MDNLSPPTSPQRARPERPRALTSMSHASTRSHKSSDSKHTKLDLTETAKDKRRLEGKSDPTKALHEAQPIAVALEDSSLDNLRDMAYKDRDGNMITDPDRSNPTRNRMERPLDTIRSFNAAAEGTTSRRASYQRPPSQFGFDGANRRSSYYGSPNNLQSPHGRAPPVRPPQGGYYRANSYGFRPDSFAEEGQQQQYQQGPPPPRHMRYQSQPYPPTQDSPNSIHSQQQSYETMTSGSDEMSKSTNPSSQNSSFDQLHQAAMRKPDEYGPNPYRQNGGMRNPYPPSVMNNSRMNGHTNGYTMDEYGIEFSDTPIPPPKQPIRFPSNNDAPPAVGGKLAKTTSNQKPEKRQSWIKRTFSKKG
ncbi:hypothetical protein H2198_004673 [Neophaeococcomyces mojaviensis]|uniref:Uncharacterized protein n=1 Tax=Neophaeococcomyces mojaviensis TaxID=3383035 RepID=A0ACC3A896_9EURO|nr:hypothetical protein H2198_004673 [Knufia sp. JES_112]